MFISSALYCTALYKLGSTQIEPKTVGPWTFGPWKPNYLFVGGGRLGPVCDTVEIDSGYYTAIPDFQTDPYDKVDWG